MSPELGVPCLSSQSPFLSGSVADLEADLSLLERIRDGDDRALAQPYDRH